MPFVGACKCWLVYFLQLLFIYLNTEPNKMFTKSVGLMHFLDCKSWGRAKFVACHASTQKFIFFNFINLSVQPQHCRKIDKIEIELPLSETWEALLQSQRFIKVNCTMYIWKFLPKWSCCGNNHCLNPDRLFNFVCVSMSCCRLGSTSDPAFWSIVFVTSFSFLFSFCSKFAALF